MASVTKRGIKTYIKNKKHTLVNAFFLLQFNYCYLVWMCHKRTINNKINRLRDHLIYNDKKSSFESLLEQDIYDIIEI